MLVSTRAPFTVMRILLRLAKKQKTPDFAWKSGVYYYLLFFKVVPPGIEPGTQGFSTICFSSKWCHQESNRGHKDFQSFALPTELWHPHFLFVTVCFSITGAKVGTFFESANLLGTFFKYFLRRFFPGRVCWVE